MTMNLTIAAATAPQVSPIVTTNAGRVQGTMDGGVSAYKGIPYGAPPTGSLRFRPPKPASAWLEIYDASSYGAPAMQLYDRQLTGSDISMQLGLVLNTRGETKIDNEDSLFLNIWTPQTNKQTMGKQRPVIVWLHGGGFAYGSGSWQVYDGTRLASKGDIVVVTVNHRLNAFGYMYLADALGEEYAASGNAGMLDLVLALRWVRDNIEQFGGDADNVTIMGESGGGHKVSTLLAMPVANGFYHKAIIQSGAGLKGVPKELAIVTTNAVLRELAPSASKPAEHKHALLSASAEQILDAVRAAQRNAKDQRIGFAPVVDGQTLPKHPFTPNAPEATKDVPILIGWNKDESTIFNNIAPWFGKLTNAELKSRMVEAVGERADELINAYQQRSPEYSPTYVYNAYLGDTYFFAPSIVLAERRLAQPNVAPIYTYNLAWETPIAGGLFKATHTLDLPLVFNNVDLAVALTGESPEARKLEHQMSSAWIAFARSGNPNINDLPRWPKYDLSNRPTMVFDAHSHVVNDLNPKIRAVLTAEYH